MRMFETVAYFAFELRAELAPEESGNVVRLQGMNRRARQIFIDRLQIRLFAEDDVGGVFALVHAPVVSGGEVPIDGAAAPGELVEPRVDSFCFPSVGDALRPLPVRNMAEPIVSHSIIDAQSAQLACQPVVSVEADLQPARQPRWHTHMTQAQILVHEVEVVMQTLAVI